MALANPILKQVAAAIRRRGKLIMLQRTSRLPGPEPLPAPPLLVTPTLAAAVVPGQSTISLNAAQADGRLLAGVRLVLPSGVFTIAATATSRAYPADPPGFDAVTLASPLTAAHAAGTPASFIFVNEEAVWAIVRGFPSNLIDGHLIQVNDYLVSIAGLNRPTFDTATLLWVDGSPGTIVKADPIYMAGLIARWDIQAR